MNSLSIGQRAPNFSSKSSGETISLLDFKGKKNVVLYFYPKDDTPGCTVEACGFRDTLSQIADTDTIVLGVSKDDAASHEKFVKKFDLNFSLLADTDGAICEAYGCWVEKNMLGKKYMGIQRTTFLIDKDGIIRHIWPQVKTEGHALEVIKALKKLDQED